MNRISPELALVDEGLECTLRRSLPGASDCLAPGTVAGAVPRSRHADADRAQPVRSLVAAALALLAVALAVAALLWNDDGYEPSVAALSKTPTAEQASAIVRPKTQTLRWHAAREAVFYNVIFWRGQARALDLWPRTATVRVPPGRLAPGVYQWFVYPAFGDSSKRRYGRVIAQGQLRL